MASNKDLKITSQLIVEKKDNLGQINLNNQAKRNAMTFEMWRDLPKVLSDFDNDNTIRCILLAGAGGKAFCSGADISQFEQNRSSEQGIVKYNLAVENALSSLQSIKKPTIAMIEGPCVGGGVGLAIACDLRIANDVSIFAVPAAKLGLGYRIDGLIPLVNIVGPSFAKEIFYTARRFNAQEALSMGLVNRVLPNSVLTDFVKRYTKKICENAPLTIKAVKVCVGEALKDRNDRDLALCKVVVDDCFRSEDYKEGRTAFMEKRTPDFRGT
ncbi:MAG: Short-chain-enoyl-CoA hydratase [Alphaproteobacteria bacterium MarineAlpha3_Bin5]|nr:enoyl-CoA hydratase [Magnetovibrio sp.]PPR77537.1 MAG: Short-chain-enoyl-CoA hydratase [Alphaproteobacteria bacterium MarineAlpha3_Bin5]|tara:strand:+ start:99 stop:908 length:810 start_codon:yes stop_codon:yes gene_type:complete